MHMTIYFGGVKSCSDGQRWFAVKSVDFLNVRLTTAVLIDCPLHQAWARFVLRYYAICNVARLFGVGLDGLERSCALNSWILSPCPMQTRPCGKNPWSMFDHCANPFQIVSCVVIGEIAMAFWDLWVHSSDEDGQFEKERSLEQLTSCKWNNIIFGSCLW